MPTASDAAIEATLALADRVSVNLEAPNAARLSRLTSTKNMDEDLVAPLRRVKRILDQSGQRVKGKIRSLSDLRKPGIVAERAMPFITLNGKAPAVQLSMPF